MYGGGDAPAADPRLGKAAMFSAKTGREALEFMRGQAGITNQWAAEDRGFFTKNIRPMQQAFIKDANSHDTAGNRNRAASDARSQIMRAGDLSRGQTIRQMTAMGVNPGSARSLATSRSSTLQTQLAALGGANAASDRVRAEGDAKRMAAIQMGMGGDVNPATSMGLSNGAGQAGFSAAMSGYGQSGQLLAKQHDQRMAQWEAQQEQSSQTWGGIGNLIGTGLSIWSDEDDKNSRKPLRGAVKKVQASPAETYRYNEDAGDGGAQERVGPMAQDFQAATGAGDGHSIPMPEMLGLHHGAIKELGDRVDALEAKAPRGAKRPANAKAAPAKARGVRREAVAA